MSNVRVPIVLTAWVALVFSGCSDGGDASSGTTATVEVDDTSKDAIRDAEAEARSAAVKFFEAQATLDYEAALDRSSGAAATGVKWAQSVNAIDQVSGTPEEIKATPSASITASLDKITESDDGLYRATGYIQVDQHPSLLAPGPIDGIEGETPSGWFITDLMFTADGDRLLVDDYRMDDSHIRCRISSRRSTPREGSSCPRNPRPPMTPMTPTAKCSRRASS